MNVTGGPFPWSGRLRALSIESMPVFFAQSCHDLAGLRCIVFLYEEEDDVHRMERETKDADT